MKNEPPSGSVVCWSDSMMFAPRSATNRESAATIPGRSTQETSSRPDALRAHAAPLSRSIARCRQRSVRSTSLNV